jgi:hypothetical protein
VEAEPCEAAHVAGYIVRRLATGLAESELRSLSERSRCKRAVAVDVLMTVLPGMYPYDCKLEIRCMTFSALVWQGVSDSQIVLLRLKSRSCSI